MMRVSVLKRLSDRSSDITVGALRAAGWVSYAHLAGAFGTVLLTFILWRVPLFTYQSPSFIYVVAAFACAAILLKKIPTLVWAWWLVGVASLAWSYAPGATLGVGLWEFLFVAAFGAGFWRRGFWLLNLGLLGYNLEQTLLLNSFGLQMYASGSKHYVAGAQALVLAAPSFYYALTSQNRLHAFGAGLLFALSLFVALLSGARAVYLPLVLASVVVLARLLWSRVSLKRLALVALLGAAVIWGFELALPFHPINAALGQKATVGAQVEAAQEGGNFSTRLQMYEQAFLMGWKHPLGTGNGSYRDVVYAFQRYPLLAFSSPHNYYLETFATGGWLRLGLLVMLILVAFWRSWFSKDWALGVGVMAYLATLAFDVTSTYPSVMMLGFLGLGTLYWRTAEVTQTPLRWQTLPAFLGLLSAVGLAAWWYLPCSASDCSVTRHLGAQTKVLREVQAQDAAQQLSTLERAAELNPRSLWVQRERLSRLPSGPARLALARDVATQFPYASQSFYVVWAEEALAQNNYDEARSALDFGLRHFPVDVALVGTPIYSQTDKQTEWLAAVERLTEQIQAERY